MVSESYRRRRRLALFIALMSVAFLAVGYYFGYFLDTYSDPRIDAAGEEVLLFHEAHAAGAAEAERILLILDGGLSPRNRIRLGGDCRAVLSEGDRMLLFFPRRYTVWQDEQVVRGAELKQDWDVRSAAISPEGEAWIFGIRDGKIVFRRKTSGILSQTEEAFDPGGKIYDLRASWRERGPVLLWRERVRMRAIRWDSGRFVPLAEAPLETDRPYAATVVDSRLLVVTQHREDRDFRTVTFRVRCCPACGREPPRSKITFADPVFLIGRRVTGLAAALRGDTVLLAVTRANTLQIARFSAATLEPKSDALRPVSSQPLWRRTVAALWPMLLLFFSFSLIFLGFSLLRERRRFLLERLAAAAPVAGGVMPAHVLQRAMAHILDFMILLPLFFVGVEWLSLVPETTVLRPGDPVAIRMVGFYLALQFVYYFLQEAPFGRTLGKRIIGIRVAAPDGSRPRVWGVLVRNLIRAVDATFVLAALGVAFMIFTRHRQRLGDLAGRTIVVENK